MSMLTNWKDDQDRRLSEWKRDLDITLSRLVTEVSDLKKECQEIKRTNSEIEKSMAFINQNYEETIQKVVEIEKEKNANTEAIKSLEAQIGDCNFLARQATIELRNVPVTRDENHQTLLATLKGVGKVVEVDVSSKDIRDIYRLPGKPGSVRPIVAEFGCVLSRNEMIAKVRGFNKGKLVTEKLNTQIIGLPGAKLPIYVDEYLPPSQRKLMFETRQFARKHNYSCWHSHGIIYIRLEPTSRPVIVRSMKCLTEALIKI